MPWKSRYRTIPLSQVYILWLHPYFSSSNLATSNLFFTSAILSFWVCYLNRIIQKIAFWKKLFSLSIMPLWGPTVCSFLIVEWYSIIWLYHHLFHHLHTMEHFSYFQFGPIQIRLSWTIVCKFLCGYKFSFSQKSNGWVIWQVNAQCFKNLANHFHKWLSHY